MARYRNRGEYTHFGVCLEISIFGDVRMGGCAMRVDVAFSGSPGNLFLGPETFLGTAVQ